MALLKKHLLRSTHCFGLKTNRKILNGPSKPVLLKTACSNRNWAAVINAYFRVIKKLLQNISGTTFYVIFTLYGTSTRRGATVDGD